MRALLPETAGQDSVGSNDEPLCERLPILPLPQPGTRSTDSHYYGLGANHPGLPASIALASPP